MKKYIRFEWGVPRHVSLQTPRRNVRWEGRRYLACSRTDRWPFGRVEEDVPKELDAMQRVLATSPRIDDDETLREFAEKWGRFGLPTDIDQIPIDDGKALAVLEPLDLIRLVISEYRLGLGLADALAKGRSLEPFLKNEGTGDHWRICWKLPASIHLTDGLVLPGTIDDTPVEPLGVPLTVANGFLVSPDAEERMEGIREAGFDWLGRLIAARASAWTIFEHEWTEEGVRLFLRVHSPLGAVWHRLGSGPYPIQCARCGLPFQPSPRLKRGHARFCGKTCAKAAERARGKKAP